MADEPIDMFRWYEFWRDGCRALAQNVCAVLHLAGEPLTRQSIAAFTDGIPLSRDDLHSDRWRETLCSRCLAKAHANAKGTEREPQLQRLGEYFVLRFVERGYHDNRMLIDAFNGILGGMTLDGEGGDPPSPALAVPEAPPRRMRSHETIKKAVAKGMAPRVHKVLTAARAAGCSEGFLELLLEEGLERAILHAFELAGEQTLEPGRN
jgi:hypothetical protein